MSYIWLISSSSTQQTQSYWSPPFRVPCHTRWFPAPTNPHVRNHDVNSTDDTSWTAKQSKYHPFRHSQKFHYHTTVYSKHYSPSHIYHYFALRKLLSYPSLLSSIPVIPHFDHCTLSYPHLWFYSMSFWGSKNNSIISPHLSITTFPSCFVLPCYPLLPRWFPISITVHYSLRIPESILPLVFQQTQSLISMFLPLAPASLVPPVPHSPRWVSTLIILSSSPASSKFQPHCLRLFI